MLKLHDLALFCVKKQLVGSLILSKLDYASTVFYPLPLCQLKRLQRVQNVWDICLRSLCERSGLPAAGLATTDRA